MNPRLVAEIAHAGGSGTFTLVRKEFRPVTSGRHAAHAMIGGVR